jgi:ribonuclease HII
MIGIDEVGRGSLVGEVLTCACFFETHKLDEILGETKLKDSKKLSEKQRDLIFSKLTQNFNVKFAIGRASLEEIESLNILNATLLAMRRAFLGLNLSNIPVFIDGNKKPKEMPFAECIIKGDSLIPQISAASIIAKVVRDAEMKKLSILIPEYEIEKNKGYGTKAHFESIKKHGLSSFHRKSWNI